jgi:type II secretory pathway component GspD/PulD (secretin)
MATAWLVAPAFGLLLLQPVFAEDEPASSIVNEEARPEEVALHPLLEAVSKQTNKPFLIEPRVRAYVKAGGITPENITYPILLSVLRINGYAAVTVSGAMNIVPDVYARFYATPIILQDDVEFAQFPGHRG